MSRTKDIKKAADWCLKARELLKIPREHLWNKDSDDSLALENGTKALQERINALKKQGNDTAVNLLLARFKELASLAEKAIQQKNLELARGITAELFMLSETQGVPTQRDRDLSDRVLNEQYSIALLKAEDLRKKLAALSNKPHEFLGTIDTTLTDAKDAATKKKFLDAITLLGQAVAIYEEQMRRHGQYQLFPSKKDRLLPIQHIAVSLDKSAAQPGNDKLGEAIKLYDQGDYSKANTTLNEAEEKFLEVGKAKSTKEDFKSLMKLRESLEKHLLLAREALARSGELYGKDTESVKPWITQAHLNYKIAVHALQATGSTKTLSENFTEGIQKAKHVIDNLKGAKEASEKVKSKDKDQKGSVLAWESLLREATKAHEEMGLITGAEMLQGQVARLLLESRQLVEDVPLRQYTEAIEKLTPYQKLFEQAKQIKPPVLNKGLGARAQEYIKNVLEPLLTQLENLGPIHIAALHRNEIDYASDLSKGNQDLALLQLADIAKTIRTEISDLTKAKQEVESKMIDYQDFLDSDDFKDYPTDFYAQFLEDADRQLSSLVSLKDWERAKSLIIDVLSRLDLLVKNRTSNEALVKTWEARRDELSKWNQLGLKLVNFGNLTSPSRLIESTSKLLNLTKPLTKVLANAEFRSDCEDLYTSIVEDLEAVEEEAESFNITTDPTILKEFDDQKRKDFKEIETKIDEITTSLNTLELQVRDTSNGKIDTMMMSYNSYRDRLSKIDDFWRGQFDLFVTTNASKEPEKYKTSLFEQLEKSKEKALDDLKVLAKDVSSLDIASLRDDITKKSEATRFDLYPVSSSETVDSLIELVERRLTSLEKMGADITTWQNDFTQIKSKQPVDKSALQSLLERASDQFLVEAKRVEGETQKWFETQIATKLKNLDLGHKYKAYAEKLGKQFTDAMRLVQCKDAELIELAKADLLELEKKLNAVVPAQGQKVGDIYKAVSKKADELASALGLGSDSVVIDCLPIKHRELDDKLNKAIAFSYESSPEEGLKELDKLTADIQKAVIIGRELKETHARFDYRVAMLEKRWKEVRKSTKTLVTEKATAFQLHLDARIEDARTFLKNEDGGVNHAYEVILKLENELDQIVNHPTNPREKLFELNAKYKQDQITVKNLARQFNEEMKYFKEVVQAGAKAALKERESKETSKETIKALKEERKRTMDGMERVVSSAKSMVKPYLALLETMPHEKAKGEPAPDLSRAIESFKQARQILVDQKGFANRLMNTGDTSNVNVQGNLKKVQDEWVARTSGFAQAIKDLADQIDAVGERLSQDDNFKNVVNKDLVKKASKFVRDLMATFPSNIFEKPILVLVDTTSSPEQRLAAREQILRLMRQQRDTILQNPLFKTLAKNPIDSASMMSALGGIRTTLKRIEIESLVGA